jgi:hypothetical protein
MPRINLPEFEDQSWFPKILRNMITDYLQFMYARSGIFLPIVPTLKRAFAHSGTARLVDLCSGAGGPVPYLQDHLQRDGLSIDATLTDKFPNLDAFRALHRETGSRIAFVEHSVDASNVPDSLTGFRTLFTGLHHLSPDLARRVLGNAAQCKQGIGIFEINERSPIALFFGLFVPLFVLVATPFIRPRTWGRFLFTYAIPLIPLVTMWDGFASNMRAYSLSEMDALIADLPPDPDYCWETGRITARGGATITYLLGLPRKAAGTGATSATGRISADVIA